MRRSGWLGHRRGQMLQLLIALQSCRLYHGVLYWSFLLVSVELQCLFIRCNRNLLIWTGNFDHHWHSLPLKLVELNLCWNWISASMLWKILWFFIKFFASFVNQTSMSSLMVRLLRLFILESFEALESSCDLKKEREYNSLQMNKHL